MRIKAVWFRTAVFHAAAKLVKVLTGGSPGHGDADGGTRNRGFDRNIDAASPLRGARGGVERQSRRRNNKRGGSEICRSRDRENCAS
jgi:hypothetical protein